MDIIYLDKSPTYIPFTAQFVGGSGKTNPTSINLIIYEESGADSSFDVTKIASSPFTPTQIDGKTGYLTKNDPEEFTQKIYKLLNNDRLLEKMGEAARKRAEQFTASKMADKMLELYKLVIHQHE